MPATVRVPHGVRERIEAVEPPILGEVEEHLARIAARPKLGTPILEGELAGMHAYEFRVNRLPVTRVFTILFEHDPEEDRIDVLDFGVMQGVPPRMGAPSFKKEAKSA